MKLQAFRVSGYRSLADVRLEGLGRFNVFYGVNGAGKSNLLSALTVASGLMSDFYADPAPNPDFPLSFESDPPWLLSVDDQPRRSGDRKLVMELELQVESSPLRLSPEALKLTFMISWGAVRGASKAIPVKFEISASGLDLGTLWRAAASDPVDPAIVQVLQPHPGLVTPGALRSELTSLVRWLGQRGFGLVPIERFSYRSQLPQPGDATQASVSDLLEEGRLVEALYRASVDPDHTIRKRYHDMRRILSGPPLERPPFEPVIVPPDTVELRELLPEPNPERLDVRLDLAGLGIAQVYSVLAHCLLRSRRIMGVEEPEAHLHAPTTGRYLRELLVRLVEEQYLDQLFVATHSNIFDLDPEGYFDVSMDDEGRTQVERRGLSDIDSRHLYEPGPAKHALQQYLEYLPSNSPVFRRADGSAVGVEEMKRLLQADDALAVEFLRAIHESAVRTVKALTSKRSEHPSS